MNYAVRRRTKPLNVLCAAVGVLFAMNILESPRACATEPIGVPAADLRAQCAAFEKADLSGIQDAPTHVTDAKLHRDDRWRASPLPSSRLHPSSSGFRNSPTSHSVE